jgi:hypothetical protein
MTRIVLCAAFLLLPAACTPPPDSDGPHRGMLVIAPEPPVRSLIGFRGRLELTGEQVGALDSIATVMEEASRPHLTTLADAGAARGLPGAEVREAVEALSEHHREADRAVSELLSEEQRAAVCEIARRQRTPDPRAAGARRDAAGGASADAPRGVLHLRTGWSWCAPAPPEPR